jgi:hypothetical protein
MPTPEQKTQLAICEWLSKQHPVIFQDHLVKIDNEGKKTVGGYMLAKRMGLRAGASDLFLSYPTKKYPGMWMEIKPDGWKGPQGKKAKLHHERQMDFLEKQKAKGYFTSFVIGVEQGIDAFKIYLKDA